MNFSLLFLILAGTGFSLFMIILFYTQVTVTRHLKKLEAQEHQAHPAARAHEGQDGQFDLPLTREALADYLGLTVETVSRQITALRDDGVISTQGYRHISIADMARLRAETGDHGSK